MGANFLVGRPAGSMGIGKYQLSRYSGRPPQHSIALPQSPYHLQNAIQQVRMLTIMGGFAGAPSDLNDVVVESTVPHDALAPLKERRSRHFSADHARILFASFIGQAGDPHVRGFVAPDPSAGVTAEGIGKFLGIDGPYPAGYQLLVVNAFHPGGRALSEFAVFMAISYFYALAEVHAWEVARGGELSPGARAFYASTVEYRLGKVIEDRPELLGGGVDIMELPKWEREVEERIRANVDGARPAILNGSIVLPRGFDDKTGIPLAIYLRYSFFRLIALVRRFLFR